MDLSTREGKKQQGRLIQIAAEEAGLSLEELAREIGCSRALLYQYVSGLVLAQTSRLQKIARRTGKPLTYFFEDQEAVPAAGPPAEPEAPDLSLELPPPLEDREEPPERSSPPAAIPEEPPESPPEIARVSLRLLEQLAGVLEAHDESQELLITCERILPYARQVRDRAAEARAWLRIGNARIQRGYPDLAIQALQIARGLAEDRGDDPLQLACRQSLGNAALAAGDTARAMEEFRKVAASPDWACQWQGLVSQAAVHEQCGEFLKASAACEAALDVIQRSARAPRADRERARTYVLSNQANIFLACGDFAGAHALSRELSLSAERSGQRDQFIEALINLAICQIYQGEWDQVDENLLRAIDLARFSGDSPRWGFIRAWRALLLVRMGDPDAAKDEAKDAHRLGLETGSRRCEIQAQLSLGEAYSRTGSWREAAYHFREALRIASDTSSAAQSATARLRCSDAVFHLGDPRDALKQAAESLEETRRLGIDHAEASAHDLIARIHSASGDLDRACQSASAALSSARRLGMPDLHWRAGALLAALLERQDQIDLALGAEAIKVLAGLRSRVAARRGEEALLEEPEALDCYRGQIRRLLKSGQEGEASRLVEESGWPPLKAWLTDPPPPVP